jgi:GNAT superfamily N-acetyltransferase
MQIRKARADEADALTALAFASKAHWGYAPETLKLWVGQLGVTAADISGKQVCVGEIGGEAAGFCALARSGDAWELDQMWVAPAFMRRGVGKALIAHALDAAYRDGAAIVAVDADPNAEAFYLACGAVRCGEVPAPIPGDPLRVRPQLEFRRA